MSIQADNLEIQPDKVAAGEGVAQSKKLFDEAYKPNSAIGDFAQGMIQEFEEHPLRLLKDAAIGAISVAAMTRFAPTVAVSLYGLGAVAGIYEGQKALTHFLQESNVLEYSNFYDPNRVEKAHQSLHSMGAAATDTLAFSLGGWSGIESLRVINEGVGLTAFGSQFFKQKLATTLIGGNYAAAQDLQPLVLKFSHSI